VAIRHLPLLVQEGVSTDRLLAKSSSSLRFARCDLRVHDAAHEEFPGSLTLGPGKDILEVTLQNTFRYDIVKELEPPKKFGPGRRSIGSFAAVRFLIQSSSDDLTLSR
jgi:hypothetical protein